MLEEVGQALFGEHWKNELSDALEVDPRTVRRWVNGTYEIPNGVWDDLYTLLEERVFQIQKVQNKLTLEILNGSKEKEKA
jgi:hypothetical protein